MCPFLSSSVDSISACWTVSRNDKVGAMHIAVKVAGPLRATELAAVKLEAAALHERETLNGFQAARAKDTLRLVGEALETFVLLHLGAALPGAMQTFNDEYVLPVFGDAPDFADIQFIVHLNSFLCHKDECKVLHARKESLQPMS